MNERHSQRRKSPHERCVAWAWSLALQAWSLERFLAHNGGRLTLVAASWFSYKDKDKTEL